MKKSGPILGRNVRKWAREWPIRAAYPLYPISLGIQTVGAPLMAVSDSRCLRHSSPAVARAADGERGGDRLRELASLETA